MKKTNKTSRLYIRLTAEEHAAIRKRALKFQSMSHFVSAAIMEFSDTSARERQESNAHLTELYTAIDSKLGHVGGNLNQAMKRINETAMAGHPINALLRDPLLPTVKQCYELCLEIRKQLFNITKTAVKTHH